MKPQKIKLFCFGFGQVAENFVKTILLEGLNLEFSVTTIRTIKIRMIGNIIISQSISNTCYNITNTSYLFKG